MSELKTRMRNLAEQMRELAIDIDSEATELDKQPLGYSDAFQLIVHALDLSSLATRLEATARRMGG